jgi:transcriptional regulator with XRE-family HTH domain
MNSLKEIREKTGWSQYRLAEYLGVSRSLVNLAEKGLRTLPTETLIKVSVIALQLYENEKLNEKGPANKAHDEEAAKELKILAAHHKKKMEDLQYKISVLQVQLGEISNLNRQASSRLTLIETLKKGKAKFQNKTIRDDKWLAWQDLDTQSYIQKKGMAKQLRLENEITVLSGYAAVHETQWMELSK